MKLFACAKISGNKDFPQLSGTAHFYQGPSDGIWVEVEVTGLPDSDSSGPGNFYGLHIHEHGDCSLPFDHTGEHYNPTHMPHPKHAGDLPVLLGNNGYAFLICYTNRLTADEILQKSIIIHSGADDFVSQPSGNAGSKIGCGVIIPC